MAAPAIGGGAQAAAGAGPGGSGGGGGGAETRKAAGGSSAGVAAAAAVAALTPQPPQALSPGGGSSRERLPALPPAQSLHLGPAKQQSLRPGNCQLWPRRPIPKKSCCRWPVPGPSGSGTGARGRKKQWRRKGPSPSRRWGSPAFGWAPRPEKLRRGNWARAPPGRRPLPWKLHPQVRRADAAVPQMASGTRVPQPVPFSAARLCTYLALSILSTNLNSPSPQATVNISGLVGTENLFFQRLGRKQNIIDPFISLSFFRLSKLFSEANRSILAAAAPVYKFFPSWKGLGAVGPVWPVGMIFWGVFVRPARASDRGRWKQSDGRACCP